MFPLGSVLYPYVGLPLHVFEPRYRAMVADALAGDQEFGVVLISRGSEVGGGDMRCDVGTVASIVEAETLEDGRILLLAVGRRRVRVESWLVDDPYPRAEVIDLSEGPDASEDVLGKAEGAVRRVRSLLSELGQVPALPHDLVLAGEPAARGWQLCELAPLNPLDGQSLLAIEGATERLSALTQLCEEMAVDILGLLAGED